MEIIHANESHKEVVLTLLDQFRDFVAKIMNPKVTMKSDSARTRGGAIFDDAIESENSAIFLANDGGTYVGILTIFKVPQIRKGTCYAEIEEMFVIPEYQGSETAKMLIDMAVEWAKKNGVSSIRLESSNELKRAHSFYMKVGFKEYGKAFERIL